MKMLIKHDGQISLKIEDVAESVAALHSDDFARFFELVMEIVEGNCGSRSKLEMQMCYVAKDVGPKFLMMCEDIVEFDRINQGNKNGKSN